MTMETGSGDTAPSGPVMERLEATGAEDVPALADRLIARALALRIQLVTAESCTAGLIAHRLSRPAGSASALLGGFVTYTKAAKIRLLGVQAELFGDRGAVTAEVATAMARGALAGSCADAAIAVTGVTGSKPDEDGNPIGRVFAAFATSHSAAALHCEFGVLTPKALTHLAIQAALLLALAELGDAQGMDLLNRSVRHRTG